MNSALEDDDTRLLGQVLAFLALLLCSFAENGLGYFPGLFGNVPKLTLIVLFVLYFYHPPIAPLPSIALAGLVHDLIHGQPLGYTSALMLVAHGWITMRKPLLARAESGSLWYEFTTMMAIVTLLMLATLVVYSGRFPALQPLVFQFGLTVLIFPVVNWVYHLVIGFASLLEDLR